MVSSHFVQERWREVTNPTWGGPHRLAYPPNQGGFLVKKLFAALLAAGLVFVGAGTASAAKGGADGETGPGDHNKHGLCTAYFNGQKNGHTEGEGPGPFGALEDGAADDGTDEDLDAEKAVSSDVFEDCQEFGIGGNPELNGRFDCRTGEEKDSPARDSDVDENGDPAPDGQLECVANGTETD